MDSFWNYDNSKYSSQKDVDMYKIFSMNPQDYQTFPRLKTGLKRFGLENGNKITNFKWMWERFQLFWELSKNKASLIYYGI